MDLPGVMREACADMGTTPGRPRRQPSSTDVRVPGEHAWRRGTGLRPGHAGLRLQPGADRPADAWLRPCLDETWEYTQERPRPSATRSARIPGNRFPLAEAETLSRGRLLCLRTLWLKDQGLPHTAEAAMCKWWAPKTGCDDHQLPAPHGHSATAPISVQPTPPGHPGLQIGDGTAQIMKLIISRQKLGRVLAPPDSDGARRNTQGRPPARSAPRRRGACDARSPSSPR